MADVWADIANEFLHLYPKGPRLLAIAGTDAARSHRAADQVAAALTAMGQTLERARSDDGDEERLRAEVIAPFRTDMKTDRVLVISGPAELLSTTARGLWNYSVWQLVDEEAPHTAASAIVDVTDEANPTRRFTDYCALPSTFSA